MLRKLVLVVCTMAVTLISCGRQVTPDRTGTSANGLAPGFMEVKFSTVGQLNFTQVWYVIALNTSGTGTVPYAINGNSQQNWLNYSSEIIIYQLPSQSAPQARVIQFIPQVGNGGIKVPTPPLSVTPQQLILIPNCNGSGTQFCVQIQRNVLAGLLPTPTPSASATPTGSPSPTPTGSATPLPFSGTWFINWFTVNPSGAEGIPGAVIDAPGLQGALDQSWTPSNPPSGNYDTATQFDFPWQSVTGWPQVSNPSAQIFGGEVLNTP